MKFFNIHGVTITLIFIGMFFLFIGNSSRLVADNYLEIASFFMNLIIVYLAIISFYKWQDKLINDEKKQKKNQINTLLLKLENQLTQFIENNQQEKSTTQFSINENNHEILFLEQASKTNLDQLFDAIFTYPNIKTEKTLNTYNNIAKKYLDIINIVKIKILLSKNNGNNNHQAGLEQTYESNKHVLQEGFISYLGMIKNDYTELKNQLN